MTHRHLASPVALIAVVFCTHCSFSPGEPWGHVETTLNVVFDPPPDRIDESGRLKTAHGYHIELEPLSFQINDIVLTFSQEDTELAAFDPGNPPEGYGLCHNGHCHAASGALVSYEEIARSTGGTDGAENLIVPIDSATSVGLNSTAAATVPVCGPSCDTPLGKLTTLTVNIQSMSWNARVFDETALRRLPPQGVTISATTTLIPALSTTAVARFGKGHPVNRTAELRLILGATLFDGIDWANFPVTTSVGETPSFVLSETEMELIQTTLREKFIESSKLSASIE